MVSVYCQLNRLQSQLGDKSLCMPLGDDCDWSEVGRPAYCGLYHSLTLILACINGERELGSKHVFIPLCFLL